MKPEHPIVGGETAGEKEQVISHKPAAASSRSHDQRLASPPDAERIDPESLVDSLGNAEGWWQLGHVNKRKFKGACIERFRLDWDETPVGATDGDFWRAKVEHQWWKEESAKDREVWDSEFDTLYFPCPADDPKAMAVTVMKVEARSAC